jgi:E1 N-terminal domain/ThiF family
MNRLKENAATLASLLGISDEKATILLDGKISILVDPSDSTGMAVADELAKLLLRTVNSAVVNPANQSGTTEVVVGAVSGTTLNPVRVVVTQNEIRIGQSFGPEECSVEVASIIPLVAACYSSGMALKAAFGKEFTLPGPSILDGMVIQISDIMGENQSWTETTFELADTYLAGAGAIGNGFIYGLSHFRPAGSLTIVDSDVVSDGNMNRCILFRNEDIGSPKASRLAANAQPLFPGCILKSEEITIQCLGKCKHDSNWLHRLIVGVDSRRVRRSLQGEIPGEVFDASSTGVAECVIHHHKQPTEFACLACIYYEAPDELARERHIAETLGVDIEAVKQHYVTREAAIRIATKYPEISAEELVSQSYDTLFKALCGEDKLKNTNNRQVLAPFAFVSVLAGVWLAIEMARRLALVSDDRRINYFRFSPWTPPVPELWQLRLRNAECEFCRQPALLRTAQQMWATV